MKKITILIISLIVAFSQMVVFAQDFSDLSSTGDKITVMGDSVVGEKTSGNVIVVWGNGIIQNDVNGNVIVIMGDLEINAPVAGEVVCIFGKVTLTDNAKIGGNLTTIGSFQRGEKAEINGHVSEINLGDISLGSFKINFFIVLRLILLVISLTTVLILGLLAIALFSKRVQNIYPDIQESLGRKMALGFLGLLGTTIILVLFFWTLLVPFACMILILMVKVVSGVFVGKAVMGVFGKSQNIPLAFIIGSIGIAIIKGLIFLIPGIGFGAGLLINAVFTIFIDSIGFGVLVDSKFGKEASYSF